MSFLTINSKYHINPPHPLADKINIGLLYFLSLFFS